MSNVKQRNSIGDRTGPSLEQANESEVSTVHPFKEKGEIRFYYATLEDRTVAIWRDLTGNPDDVFYVQEGHYLNASEGGRHLWNHKGMLFEAIMRQSKILQPFMKVILKGDDGEFHDAYDFLDPEKVKTTGPIMIPVCEEYGFGWERVYDWSDEDLFKNVAEVNNTVLPEVEVK